MGHSFEGKNMRRRQSLAFLIAITFFSAPAFGQNGYEYKKRQNRYEGVRELEVGAPDLELLSFVGNRQEVPQDANVILKLQFFMAADTNLYITAKELFLRKFYVMKAAEESWTKGWQVFSPWPTSEVINPLEVRIDQIGIVARLHHDRIGSGHIAPVNLYHSQSISAVEQYVLHLRPKETLSRVTYSLFRTGSREPFQSKTMRKTLLAREPFLISLDLTDLPEGDYELIIKSRIRNKVGGPSRKYIFYHKPVIGPESE